MVHDENIEELYRLTDLNHHLEARRLAAFLIGEVKAAKAYDGLIKLRDADGFVDDDVRKVELRWRRVLYSALDAGGEYEKAVKDAL